MYCEQMMLEEGFEDSPARRVIVATDAIWRACRIILDIELHRGRDRGRRSRRLPRRAHPLRAAGRPRRGPPLHADAWLQPLLPAGQGPAAAAPRGRAAAPRERVLPEAASTTRCCTRAICRSHSIVGCWRAKAAGRPCRGAAAGPDAGHPQPRHPGRAVAARVVAGGLDGGGLPHRPSRSHRGVPRGPGSLGHPPRRPRRRAAGAARQSRGHRVRWRAPWRRPCRSRAASTGRSRSSWPSLRGPPVSWCPLWAVVEDAARLAGCLRIAGDWLAVGLDARPESLHGYPWRHRGEPRLDELARELLAAGVRRFVVSHLAAAADDGAVARATIAGLRSGSDAEVLVAGGVVEPCRSGGPARRRRGRRHRGRGALQRRSRAARGHRACGLSRSRPPPDGSRWLLPGAWATRYVTKSSVMHQPAGLEFGSHVRHYLARADRQHC